MFITMKRYVTGDIAENGMVRQNVSFKDQLMPHLVDIVLQELYRMNLVEQRRSDGAAKIQNFDKRGREFCFFPELNTYKFNDGTPFKEAVMKAADVSMREVRRLAENALNDVMSSLFREFLHDLGDLSEIIDQLESLDALITREDTNDDSEIVHEALDKLEEYFWNSTFATSQIIQMTTTDLAYYKNPVDFQKRFKEVYAAGGRLNTNTKYGRKTENTVYISDQIITASRYTGIKKSLQQAVNEGRISKDFAKWVLGQAKEINVADAQAFRNPYAFRAVLDMMGKWNDDMEESFQRLLRGDWNQQDLSIVWQTLKPFVFSNVQIDNGTVSHTDPNGKETNPLYGRKMRVPH